MTQPPPITPPKPPTLDLRGPARRALHPSHLAIIACWLLAAEAAIILVNVFLAYGGWIPYINWNPALASGFHAGFVWLEIPLFAAAAVLFAAADLTRGQISPWPRRAMAILAVITAAAEVLYSVYYRLHIEPVPSAILGMEPAHFWFAYDWIRLTVYAFAICATLLGLIYALQIAGWLQSRTFAVASLAFLGADLLGDALHLAMAAALTARQYGIDTPLRPWWSEADWTTYIFDRLLAVALLCYWTILARKLRKMQAAA